MGKTNWRGCTLPHGNNLEVTLRFALVTLAIFLALGSGALAQLRLSAEECSNLGLAAGCEVGLSVRDRAGLGDKAAIEELRSYSEEECRTSFAYYSEHGCFVDKAASIAAAEAEAAAIDRRQKAASLWRKAGLPPRSGVVCGEKYVTVLVLDGADRIEAGPFTVRKSDVLMIFSDGNRYLTLGAQTGKTLIAADIHPEILGQILDCLD